MANTQRDVLEAALAILDEFGLADLSMRRLATALDIRPSALYWHYPNKQTLLAAVADEVLAAVPEPAVGAPWTDQLRDTTVAMRAAMRRYKDSAEVISSAYASGLITSSVGDYLVTAARAGGVTDDTAEAARTALSQFVIGFTIEQQTREQMERLKVTEPSDRDFDAEFDAGLGLIVTGIRSLSDQLV